MIPGHLAESQDVRCVHIAPLSTTRASRPLLPVFLVNHLELPLPLVLVLTVASPLPVGILVVFGSCPAPRLVGLYESVLLDETKLRRALLTLQREARLEGRRSGCVFLAVGANCLLARPRTKLLDHLGEILPL